MGSGGGSGGGGGGGGGAGGSRTSCAGLLGSGWSPGYPQGGRRGSGGGMGGRCSGASWGLTALSLSTAAEGSGGAGGIRGRGGGVQGTGGGATEGFPLVGGTGWDTNGALFGEAWGKGGGGGGGGGGVGGGGAGTLGRGGTGLAELCASEALPSLGDAGAGRGPLMALVGSRGEGAREPGPCPVLPPGSETHSRLEQQHGKGKVQGSGQHAGLTSLMSLQLHGKLCRSIVRLSTQQPRRRVSRRQELFSSETIIIKTPILLLTAALCSPNF